MFGDVESPDISVIPARARIGSAARVADEHTSPMTAKTFGSEAIFDAAVAAPVAWHRVSRN
jgi:hypothetical protein